MSVLLHTLRGLWVITYSEGVKVGSVQDVIVDSEQKKVAGFLVHTGNPITGKKRWLPADKVKKVGLDVVFVPNENSLLDEKCPAGLLEDLQGMPVSSKDGSKLGKAEDFSFVKSTWQIDSICLSENKKVMLDLAETVFGPDLILVQANPELTPCKPAVANEAHLVNDVTDALRRHASSAFKQGEDVMKKASDSVKEMLKSVETDLDNMMDSDKKEK